MHFRNLSHLSLFLLAFACKNPKQTDIPVENSNPPFINPPIKNVNVPFTLFNVMGEKGDTIVANHSSLLIVPPDSFIDSMGQIVKGNIEIKYREFIDPIDIYLSGITMNYDSAGLNYTFQSSFMLELIATQNNQRLNINPKNKIEALHLSDKNWDKQNVYYLDTNQRKWVYTENLSLLKEQKSTLNQSISGNENHNQITEPMKPIKARKNLPIIEVEVDPLSIKDILMYDKLQFQLDPSVKSFNASDTGLVWENVKLLRDSSKQFFIAFSRQGKLIKYPVVPVISGEYYQKALDTYAVKKKEYDNYISKNKNSKSNPKFDSIQFKKTYDLSYKLNSILDILDKQEKMLKDLELKRQQSISEERAAQNLKRIINCFVLDKVGIWNCDQIMKPEFTFITVEFRNVNDSILILGTPMNLVKSYNTMLPIINGTIPLHKLSNNFIFGLYQGQLAYITNSELKKQIRFDGEGTQSLKVTIVSPENNNYPFIKSLAL